MGVGRSLVPPPISHEAQLRFRRRALGAIVVLLIIAPVMVLAGFRAASAQRETVPREVAAPAAGHFVRAADVELFVQEAGPPSGPVVVLVHGTGAWSEIWRRTLDTLAVGGYHAVAVDMPPFGYSERPANADYGDEAQARRILGVVATLGLRQVTLVAHSFGGRPSMEAYFLDPSRFARLVLVDAALGLDTGTAGGAGLPVRAALAAAPVRDALVSATLTNPMVTGRLLRGLVSDPAAVTPERITMLQRPFVREGTTVAYGEWLRPFLLSDERSMARERARYREIPVPTLVLWGAADAITPIAQGREIAALVPRSTWVELAGVGHIPAIESTDRFNGSLVRWLDSTSAAGPIRARP
jgi:pimeloyl-ACP methyl ester carboxylesterase